MCCFPLLLDGVNFIHTFLFIATFYAVFKRIDRGNLVLSHLVPNSPHNFSRPNVLSGRTQRVMSCYQSEESKNINSSK